MSDDVGNGAAEEPGSDLTLADELAEAVAGLQGVTAGTSGQLATWAAGPSVFATLDGERAEFRLDPMVAAAALRTPDASPSPRGADCPLRNTGSSTVQTWSATMRAPSAVGWMPSFWFRRSMPATPSSRNGSSGTPYSLARAG